MKVDDAAQPTKDRKKIYEYLSKLWKARDIHTPEMHYIKPDTCLKHAQGAICLILTGKTT